jgi:ABC-type branched-subunit amino acid transport system ATPase component
MTMPLLELHEVSRVIGGLRILHQVSLHVAAGEVVGLIGPNGAGKTTVLNLISGLDRPTRGDIRFAGRSIAGLSPDAITPRGLARTFQSLRVFLNMSVLENVMAAAAPRTHPGLLRTILRTPGFRREEQRIRQQAEEMLALFGNRLQGYRYDQPASSLSYANRRRLELARALMTQPRLLLLDEPAAGMNPHETDELTEVISDLRERFGCAILLIEHDMGMVERLSDRVVVLDYGEQIAQGSFAQVAADARVIEAYLGRREHDDTAALAGA